MNPDTLKIVIDVAQFFLTGGIGVWLWIINRNDSTNQRINGLENVLDSRLDNHAQRITSLEAHSKTAPTHDDMGDLHERINTMAKGVDTMAGEFGALRRTVDTIHNFLLNGGKR